MEECCDICGDIGSREALITCNQCKINIEHIEKEVEVSRKVHSAGKWYCMRTILEKFVDDWICEECKKPCSKPKQLLSSLHGYQSDESKTNSLEVCKDGKLRAESRKFQNTSREGAGNWKKMAPVAKTKYISVKEAIMLSAGDQSIAFHPRGRKSGRGGLEKAATRAVVPNFSSHQNIASTTLRPPKLPIPGNKEIHVKQLKQSKKLTDELRSGISFRPSEALKDTHKEKEQPREVQLPPVTRKLVKQSPAPPVNASTVAISGGDDHNNAIYPSISGGENMSNNLLLDPETYSLIPASDALWKGSFRIQGTNTQAKANHLIKAHPPSLVHRKVHEFSKQMPEVLHLKLVPSITFRNNLFNEQIPEKGDIALYFFSGERSEEDYTHLVESISSTNLALWIQIADIELLVFSSKLLSVNCQRLEGKYYLWGVFHRLELDSVMPLDNWVLELPVQPSDDGNHDKSQGSDPEEVDMEIDMIGGTRIGRIDIRVPKKPTAAMALLPDSAQQIASASRGDFAPVLTTPPNVKIDPNDLIPPGFEEIYRLRMQNLLSPVNNVGCREANKVLKVERLR